MIEAKLLFFIMIMGAICVFGGIGFYDLYKSKICDDYYFYEVYKKKYEDKEQRRALAFKLFIWWFFICVAIPLLLGIVIL